METADTVTETIPLCQGRDSCAIQLRTHHLSREQAESLTGVTSQNRTMTQMWTMESLNYINCICFTVSHIEGRQTNKVNITGILCRHALV